MSRRQVAAKEHFGAEVARAKCNIATLRLANQACPLSISFFSMSALMSMHQWAILSCRRWAMAPEYSEASACGPKVRTH